MNRSWQKRRSEFNHDWLKNNYIISLSTVVNILDDKYEDYDYLHMFINNIFQQFEYYKQEAFILPIDFVIEMSPKRYLSAIPFTRLDNDTKRCLGDLIHYLWIERYNITCLVETALYDTKKTYSVYENLLNAIIKEDDNRSIVTLKKYKDMFCDLLSSCRSLSRTIEKFPSNISVV